MDRGWEPGRKGTGSRTGTEMPKVTGRVGKNYTTLKGLCHAMLVFFKMLKNVFASIEFQK